MNQWTWWVLCLGFHYLLYHKQRFGKYIYISEEIHFIRNNGIWIPAWKFLWFLSFRLLLVPSVYESVLCIEPKRNNIGRARKKEKKNRKKRTHKKHTLFAFETVSPDRVELLDKYFYSSAAFFMDTSQKKRIRLAPLQATRVCACTFVVNAH